MPVFFGVAGLSIDLKVLGNPDLLWLAALLIGIASIGKLGGCYIGSRLARLNHPESLAVGLGMNARGSTEVILATIGLSMGVLNPRLFTIIVLMAVVTTLCMPPLLRWALARVPTRPDEQKRIEAEQAEEHDLMPKVERVLVGLDGSEEARLAARLAGWLVGARRLTATVIDASGATKDTGPAHDVATEAANAGKALAASEAGKRARKNAARDAPAEKAAKPAPVRDLISIHPVENHDPETAILTEAEHGYGLLILGLGGANDLQAAVENIFREFAGPIAILLNAGSAQAPSDASLERILVPATGADYSRFGAEVAVAIARGCGGAITALHVSIPPADSELLRRPEKLLRTGRALLADIVALGKREEVHVVTKALVGPAKESAILRQARLGGHQLIVLGITATSDGQLHFGQSAEAIVESAPCPVLIVKS